MEEIEKGWGKELIFANERYSGWYCGKLLVFKPNGVSSLHFHIRKQETWYVSEGKFGLLKINPNSAERIFRQLKPGDVVKNEVGEVHQLTAGPEGGVIFEVSSPDYREDSYRVEKGDSQR